MILSKCNSTLNFIHSTDSTASAISLKLAKHRSSSNPKSPQPLWIPNLFDPHRIPNFFTSHLSTELLQTHTSTFITSNLWIPNLLDYRCNPEFFRSSSNLESLRLSRQTCPDPRNRSPWWFVQRECELDLNRRATNAVVDLTKKREFWRIAGKFSATSSKERYGPCDRTFRCGWLIAGWYIRYRWRSRSLIALAAQKRI